MAPLYVVVECICGGGQQLRCNLSVEQSTPWLICTADIEKAIYATNKCPHIGYFLLSAFPFTKSIQKLPFIMEVF